MLAQVHAAGKVILFGEHAVVYGRPALAVGIEGAISLQGLLPSDVGLRIRVPHWKLDASERSTGRLGEWLRRLRAIMPGDDSCSTLIFDTWLPAGAGLGSSAALAVAAVRGLGLLRGLDLDPEDVRCLAHELEKIFHGHPSGLDDSLACYGGVCIFRKDGKERFQRLEHRTPTMVVGHTGIERSTRRLVSHVRDQVGRNPVLARSRFDEIERCFSTGVDALRTGDLSALGEAMTDNQRVLRALGLSCPEIEELIRLAQDAGATGAKLTGAGGGGAVVAVSGDPEAVRRAWRTGGFDSWIVRGEPLLSGAPRRQQKTRTERSSVQQKTRKGSSPP